MRTALRYIFPILAAGIVSCSKIAPLNKSPFIEHRLLTFSEELQDADPIFVHSPRDTIKVARLSFSLTDGDGNVGRSENDTADSTSPGIHLWLYLPSGGSMVAAQDTSLRYLYYQLPEIEAYSTAGQIKADVELVIDTYRKSLFRYDTVAYRYYVVDKAGRRSNVLFTPQAALAR